jgi:tetratricopeptide (TPR) repeat protein/predicted aspartyl protease
MAVRAFAVTVAAFTALAFVPRACADTCKIARIAELPVTMSGLRPMVTAKINGRDAKFIADSGAFYSMIGTASAAEYGLSTKPTGMVIHGVGGRTLASATTVKEFTLAGVPIHDVEFIVLGSGAGQGAVGLLGQNVWRLADVEYDLANGAIRLLKSEECRKTMMVYWGKPGEPYSVMDINWATAASPHTTGTAYLNGKKIRVLFDTGASMSLVSLGAAARAGVKPDTPGVEKAGASMGIGSHLLQTWVAPFDSFKIGDEEIRHTKLRFGQLDSPEADMLIGADFFLSHRIYVASSQGKLYFTYNGGPVFNLAAPPIVSASPGAMPGAPGREAPASPDATAPPSGEPASQALTAGGPTGDSAQPAADASPGTTPEKDPTDAAGFSRRGTAFAARRDFAHAIADLTRATELAPGQAEYFYERGRAYLGNRQPQLAMGDFDEAIELKPDYVAALVARAELRLARRDRQGRGRDRGAVIADVDKASASADADNDVHLRLATLYLQVDAFPAAIDQYDLWLNKHEEDPRTPDARAGRCRARALLGKDLGDALSDCNRAVRARSDAPFIRGSRGLVYLRMGRYDKAVADYDAALSAQPKNAWALYCRGVARVHEGMTKEGQADIAASRQIAPGAAAEAERLGIKP